jgi:CBS domain-containing protein
MKVAEVMTRNVEIANPDDTIEHAAQLMAQLDVGILPVGENDRLVGMLSDRDIAVRIAAKGKSPGTARVREAMSEEVKYCFEDEDTEHVARNMGEQRLRRLPVLRRDKRLVGILSLADIAVNGHGGASGDALEGVSQPGGQHSQSGHAYAGQKPNPQPGS